MRTLTLSDASGDVVSILEVPDHATPEATDRIVAGAAALANVRGFTVWCPDEIAPRMMPVVRLRPAVCRCLSGSTCDVSHDPARCSCRQCVAAEAIAHLVGCEPSDRLRAIALQVYRAPWPSTHGRDTFPRPSDAGQMIAIRESAGADPAVCTIADWLDANTDCPPAPSDVARVRALPFGASCTLDYGAGGRIHVRKVGV